MTQALYRRYRPQSFADIVGQSHVADTLRNALRQQRIGHAYLFTGPRGTGKTSTARILAKAVNCLAADVDDRPDNSCPICQAINESRLLDLIEIDAASNTSVDDVRELRDRVAFVPSEARYKVYVIDEVHMLSTSAFNALLKTLEEPPEHVIFILATTEPHKIPATVLSRCQRFDFHRISSQDITAHLQEIARREGVQITPEAVATIARSATGSMRDALSLLDQIISYGHVEIDVDLVRDVLGMVSGEAVSHLADALAGGDPATVLTQLHALIEQGVEMTQLVVQLIEHLRLLLLLNVGRDARLVDLPASMVTKMTTQASAFQPAQLLHTIRTLNDAALALKTPFAGYLPVELALLDAVGVREQPVLPAAPVTVPAATPVAAKAQPQPRAHTQSPANAGPQRPQAPPATSSPSPAGDVHLQKLWDEVVALAGKYSPKIQAVLRGGRPMALVNDELVISFQYSFHLETTQSEIETVSKVVAEVFGRPLVVRPMDEKTTAQYVASLPPETPPSPPPSAPPATTAEPAPTPADDPLLRMAVEDLGAQVKSTDPKQA